MIKVGITGGIGSGKTIVCKFFELLNIQVFYADIEAKKIINEDISLKKQLIENFGENIYQTDGNINKNIFAKIIFSDTEKLELSNSLIHPAVQKSYEKWCAKHSQSKYTLKEAAILFESGNYKQMDYVITVISPLDERIENVMKRDKISKELLLKKINNQLSDDFKIKNADFVIYNQNNKLIIPQVIEIHNFLLINQNPEK